LLKFIKHHWFGLLVSISFGLFLIEFFLVMFAPHVDIQNRGFVPCTAQMAEEIEICSRKKLCIIKAVTDNYVCDAKVILGGVSQWLQGQQPRPWSNYLFEPELPQEEVDEGLQEYYDENPNLADEMAELKQKYKELEIEKNEK